MDAVRTLNHVDGGKSESAFAHKIDGATVENIWTDFFYNEKKVLCFHVQIDLKDGGSISFEELKDYSDYKNLIERLLIAKNNKMAISVPKKIGDSGWVV